MTVPMWSHYRKVFGRLASMAHTPDQEEGGIVSLLSNLGEILEELQLQMESEKYAFL